MECIICGKKKFKKLKFIKEVSRYTRKPYSLFQCLSCGFTRPDPLPYDEENKMDIYDEADNIRFFDKKKGEIKYGDKEYKYYFKHFTPYLKFIEKYKIKGKAIDIGCGQGHLMELLLKRGIDAEGMEITEKLVRALNKRYKVHFAEVGDKKMEGKKYSLLLLNQVLEHIVEPESFVIKMNKMLEDKGYIILAVPYIWGLVPQILRTKWYGLGFGQHVNFFSEKSLRILFEKNGFEILEFKKLIVDYAHPKFPRFLNTIADFISRQIVNIGLGDNLFMVARKIKGIRK